MDIGLHLLLKKPINIDGIGTLYQPTIDDIFEYDIEEYNKIIIPYRVSLDMLKIEKEEENKFKTFDLLLMDKYPNQKLLTIQDKDYKETSYLELFQKSLIFFFRKEVAYIPYFHCFRIGDTGIVDRDNFDILADIVLQVSTSERIKIEKEPEFKSDRQRKVWEKLKKGRERNAQKNEITIPTIINNVMYGGKSYISSEEICKMTMWHLINAYKSILNIDSFYLEYKKYIAGEDTKKLDLTHWSTKLKINN